MPDAWDSAGAAVRIVKATSSEPDAGTFAGDRPGDVRLHATTVCLRAERAGDAAPRVYTLTLEAKDAYGNPSTTDVPVTVPGGGTACAAAPYRTVPETDVGCQPNAPVTPPPR